jgi:tetratricopeptide (TPR) repeat protein
MNDANHISSPPMNRAMFQNHGASGGDWLRAGVATILVFIMAGCAFPTKTTPSAPSIEEITRQQRITRAQANLGDGLKKYERGSFDEAVNFFLAALDSGQLTLAEQLIARKHMAFVHCLGGREANCKEEFEKVIALDKKFDLSPAESGHPIWGPVYRLARTEIELRQSGRAIAAPTAEPVNPMSAGDKLFQEARKSYDDADYNKSIKTFHEALKLPLTLADQIAAHKYIAFSYCLTNRMAQCRAAFEPIFKLDANFDLTPAEAGHPSWEPSFRAVKAKHQVASKKK